VTKFSEPRQILYVDDCQDSCELSQFILANEGYQVETACSVADGLRIAQAGNFALYLIDLTLADGTGFALIEGIRRFDLSTPIVVCSGQGLDSVQEAARQAGVKAFLLKPIDPEVLVQTVTMVMG